MTTLPGWEVARLAHGAGFGMGPAPGVPTMRIPGEDKPRVPMLLEVMVAIAKAESGWRTDAVNSQSGATGLWQIYPGGKRYLDPKVNAAAAHAKYRAQGLGAWSAYKNGAWKGQIQPAALAVTQYRLSDPKPHPSMLDEAKGAIGDVADWATKIGNAVTALFSGALWLRILMVLGGAVLGVIALNLLLKTLGVDLTGAVKR